MGLLSGARILVAGGTSFIGANLIPRLLSLGCQVRATLHVRPAAIVDDAIEYVQADLTCEEDCQRAVEGADIVFMCAANTSGAAVMATTPLAHVTPNVVMNAQMLDASYRAGIKKFVFISSSAAYPPSGDRPVREDEMFGGDPYEVYYSVGWMKRYAEILCKTYASKIKDPMPVLVVRPSNIYGPYDKFDLRSSHVTAALIRRVVERESPVEVWGTGDDVRDLIFIDDFIDGLLMAVEYCGAYMVVNIASGRGYSVKQILHAILEADGYNDAEVQFKSSKPSTIGIRLIDIGLARQALGFEPKIDLGLGLGRTLAWYRQNRSVWVK